MMPWDTLGGSVSTPPPPLLMMLNRLCVMAMTMNRQMSTPHLFFDNSNPDRLLQLTAIDSLQNCIWACIYIRSCSTAPAAYVYAPRSLISAARGVYHIICPLRRPATADRRGSTTFLPANQRSACSRHLKQMARLHVHIFITTIGNSRTLHIALR
jgi:hypothetical protein